jgi:hypothetical protein
MASIDREVDPGDNDTAEIVAEVPVEQDVVEDELAVRVADNDLVRSVLTHIVLLSISLIRVLFMLTSSCPLMSIIGECKNLFQLSQY